jgi:hypothetical protein
MGGCTNGPIAGTVGREQRSSWLARPPDSSPPSRSGSPWSVCWPERFETLGGLVMTLLGRIPVSGDHVAVGGFRLEVVDMDGRRVDKVLVMPPGASGPA